MVNCKLINISDFTLQERELCANTIIIDEAVPHVFLNTCNRSELYWGEGCVPEKILRHLYRVACGLESGLIGERAIQGQLKTAYKTALIKYKLSSQLNRLFQSAIHVGKRVRTETRIAEGAISHSQVTVEMLKEKHIDLKNKIVGIIGVNKLTEDILKYLASNQAVNILLANRNLEKAEALAKQYNATAIRLIDKQLMLQFADVLICATSAPHVILKKEDLPTDKDILIFDLAFPRDVDEDAGGLEKVELFNLEDIEKFAKKSLLQRMDEINKVELIIENEIQKFYEWQSFANQYI